jgi:NitT/TauT family transport system ATP-binding protein
MAFAVPRGQLVPVQPDTKVLIRNVHKIFSSASGPVLALAGIDLEIPRGTFVCIVGPSGCGKSTLLRMLCGLDEPTTGEIDVARAEPGHPAAAMVFQEQSIFPWFSVIRNIEYGLWMRGVPKRERRERAMEYLHKVGLSGFADSYPHELSGGMKQRVSVARAFANDSEILLMDEPFAALDEQTKALLQEELLRVWDEKKKTVVFITHSIDEALALGDQVVVMTARPGRVKAVIPVPFPRPRSIYELKAQPEFGRAVREIWNLLRDEVLNAQREALARHGKGGRHG